eukprot:SAG22_NODE_876_length_6716_cov_2.126190_1_plen_493_part_00
MPAMASECRSANAPAASDRLTVVLLPPPSPVSPNRGGRMASRLARIGESVVRSAPAAGPADAAEPARLPHEGSDWATVSQTMEALRVDDSPWHSPKMFKGGSYFGRQDVVEVSNAAYAKYINYNQLYAATAFPSLKRYDEEVVQIMLDLLHARPGAGGALTTGGTESILLSVKTAVHWAMEAKPGLTDYEIIVPHATHPGFDKAASMLGDHVKMVRLPGSSAGYRADMAAVAAAITPSTIMLVGSAPSYPFGVSDDLPAMDRLAGAHGLWLHVDACNGGMVFPFARKIGRKGIPAFDFELPNVRSICVDIHKLGYSNKGVSILALRDAEDERHHRFTFTNWPAGAYSTASIAGSRSGGGVASAWAVMKYLGSDGYCSIAAQVYAAVDAFVAAIEAVPGLEVLGEPEAYLIAFASTSEAVDIYAVDAGMAARGWLGSQCHQPPAIHLFIDGSHSPAVAAEYGADLVSVVADVRAGIIKPPETVSNVLGVYTRD